MRLMPVLNVIRSFSPSFVNKLLQLQNNVIIQDDGFRDIYWQLCKENRMLLSIREAYNLYYYLNRVKHLQGALAELGVYKGGSAKLICEFKSDSPLYLFDTFGGMPDVLYDVDRHQKGDFDDTSLKSVKNYLAEYTNIHFCDGIFPESSEAIPDDVQFCFVHLDVDIYKSTLSGLDYFYPRLTKGGVLISHDYYSQSCPGVKRAFDEFFLNKPEEVTHLWDTQCLIVKE